MNDGDLDMVVPIEMDPIKQICEIWGWWSRRNHAWLTSFKLEQLGKWWCHLFRLNIGSGEDLEQGDSSSLTCLIWGIFVKCMWRFWVDGLIFMDGAQEKKVQISNVWVLLEIVGQISFCGHGHLSLITCYLNNDF